ncbi:MAG: SigF/SigG family RNA polymerase sporulation sigma factor [Clostridia bacterium]|nr:SigF/SigG family RNA polymerase sporulation sigma factor [Clostridia bacterium]
MNYLDIYDAISLAKSGDAHAREYVVTNNMGLVWSIVRKFLNRGYESDDLFQIGCIGLLKSIEKFDSSFGVKFSTYAVPMIMGEIKRYIRDDGIIKVSRNLKEISIKARAVMDRLSKEYAREPTVKEIADEIGISAEELAMALEAAVLPESINSVVRDDGRELESVIDSGKDMELDILNRIAVKDALSNLSVRERQIIFLRYFKDKTQTQIASQLGISQVQVSRIEKKVLKRMKVMMEDNMYG